MIFEFLIAYHRTADTEIVEVIRGCLANVLEGDLNEFYKEAVERMVILRMERLGDYVVHENDGDYRRGSMMTDNDLV